MTAVVKETQDKLERVGLLAEYLPKHIAIIMDGNGRWAQGHSLPRIEGHRRGVKTVQMVVEECSELGIEQLTLYCLSSENWKRPKKELNMLMRLLEQYAIEERSEIMRQNLRFSIIGRTDGLSPGVLTEVEKTIRCSQDNQGMRLCLAVNYGSRSELVDAVRSIAHKTAAGYLDADSITEQTIAEHLYTAGMIDPDLLIRTAGELRVSNFLLWQISYAEIWVSEKCWPEFHKPDLIQALKDYAARDRRFGGLSRPNGKY